MFLLSQWVLQEFNHCVASLVSPAKRLKPILRYHFPMKPGGAWNVQVVRNNGDALKLVSDFYNKGLPVAAICAGTTVWNSSTFNWAVRGVFAIFYRQK